MGGNAGLLMIVVLIIIIVVGSKYVWQLKQEVTILKEQSSRFVTMEDVDTYVRRLDRETLKDAFQRFAEMRTKNPDVPKSKNAC